MPSHVKVEENLIRGRKTHWESWAVDLLASTMSSRIANRTKLPVRRSPGSAVVDGQVRTASGRILATSDLEREVFALADPGQTVETVAARAGIAPAEVLEAAGRLADRKVLHLGFEVPVSDDCLGDLHRQLVAAFGPADAESLVAFERLVDLTGVIGGVTDDEQARIVYLSRAHAGGGKDLRGGDYSGLLNNNRRCQWRHPRADASDGAFRRSSYR